MANGNELERYRLKAIKFNCDFRSSELSNYQLLLKKKHFDGPPGKNEVYLMVSKSGNQLIWILNLAEVESASGVTRTVIDSRRWRLDGGSWSPQMLENYANAVGISLVGFKRLEDAYLES